MDKKRVNPAEGKTEEQETRKKILAAASLLMAERGLKGATTRRIAEEAGVNEVTIFRHFGKKDGLVSALLEEVSVIRPQLEALQHQDYDSVKDFLTHYGDVFYQTLVERKEILIIAMKEAQNLVEESHCILSAIPKEAVLVLIEKLNALHKEGKVARCDFGVASHMYISSFFAAFLMRYQVGNGIFEISEEQLKKSSAEIILKALQI
ncbi:TetR/AcrR family transcriptional regulator [Brevibacillus sp. SYSU BS000544]|uniref:TetR/AcrR family transcriptional regulator n=1 Tax=Brevibacillus sp. SYSU BS000544 TaxID=3416443 RepID=UPI003CE5211F